MEYSEMQAFSLGSWLFATVTFVIGVLVKFFFNILSTPKLEVEGYVVLDKDSKAWVRVKNRSKWIKAYDLRFFIAFYQNGERIHTKIINDGVMKNRQEDTYSITPKNEKKEVIPFDITTPNNYVEVTLLFKNKFNTFSVIEKKVVYKV